MAERLKAVDCKSIDKFYVGSNPTFFINIYILKFLYKIINDSKSNKITY